MVSMPLNKDILIHLNEAINQLSAYFLPHLQPFYSQSSQVPKYRLNFGNFSFIYRPLEVINLYFRLALPLKACGLKFKKIPLPSLIC
jgi:hypothetical protein